MRRLAGMSAGAGLVLGVVAMLSAATTAPVADAVMAGDVAAVRAMLKNGADVNGAQGDGMTALHWAAMKGQTEIAQMLIYAGANHAATTRLGAYTPLHLAAKTGSAPVVDLLVSAGAHVRAVTTTGATPLMMAAESGVLAAAERLLAAGADVNVVESAKGQSALMFAAAFDRTSMVTFLLATGADAALTTKVVDLAKLTDPNAEQFERAQQRQQGAAAPAARPVQVPGLSRQFRYNELIGTQGGLTALLFAAREGYAETALALLAGGANVNQVNPGDRTSPLLMAVINGHFDLAMRFLERGADVSLPAVNGAAPLFATLNHRWAPKSQYPNPKGYQQQTTSYLQLMQALLDKGADPNARIQKKVWYQAFNSDFAGVDEIGATPFWRAAYASDVEAMRLLVTHGADPHISTVKPAGRPFTGDGIRVTSDVCHSAGAGGRPCGAAAAGGVGRGLRRRLCRQLASLRRNGLPRGHQIPGRGDRRRCERGGSRRQHRAASGRVTRRQRVDRVSGVEGRARDRREPRRADHRGHGQRPGAAHAALSRHHRAAREAGRGQPPQVRVVLIR